MVLQNIGITFQNHVVVWGIVVVVCMGCLEVELECVKLDTSK